MKTYYLNYINKPVTVSVVPSVDILGVSETEIVEGVGAVVKAVDEDVDGVTVTCETVKLSETVVT